MSNHTNRQHPFACIVDGDNVARGGQLEPADVRRVLVEVRRLSDGQPVTFAMQSQLATTYMTTYADLGWHRRFASMAPDAADMELLEAAQCYREQGVQDLIVVSGDHAFADLARHFRLHVVCYRSSLSLRLRLAATTITYVDNLLEHRAA